MEQVGQQGRTVLFVSHNMGAIKTLCQQGIVLESGNLDYLGSINKAILNYNSARERLTTHYFECTAEYDHPFIQRILIFQDGKNDSEPFKMHLPIKVTCDVEDKNIKPLTLGIVLRNTQGDWIIHSSDEFAECPHSNPRKREFTLPPNLLAEGEYYLIFTLGSRIAGQVYQKLEDIVKFRVEFSGKMADKTTAINWKGFLGPGIVQWN